MRSPTAIVNSGSSDGCNGDVRYCGSKIRSAGNLYLGEGGG